MLLGATFGGLHAWACLQHIAATIKFEGPGKYSIFLHSFNKSI